MGRILRDQVTEDIPTSIDLGMITPGKILIKPVGADVRVGYDQTDVASTGGANYYTLYDGTDYVFDIGPGVGVLSNRQQLFFNCSTSDIVIEIWIANEA